MNKRKRTNMIVVHISDSKGGNERDITEWHEQRDFEDNGYHFAILNGELLDGTRIRSMDGSIENGRPLGLVGAHAAVKGKAYNSQSIGICLIGKPNKEGVFVPTIKQLLSLRNLCKDLMKMYGIHANSIYGHYELDNRKICPAFDMVLFRKWIMSNDYDAYKGLLKL